MADSHEAFDAEPPVPGPSPFEELKAKRASIDIREPLELAVPGYGGELVAVYGPDQMEWEDVNKLLRKMERSNVDRAELYGACDILARLCIDMKMRVGDKLVPIGELAEDLEDDPPVRYDENLARAVGVDDRIDPKHPTRSIVIAVFGNDFALVGHQNDVVRWLGGDKESEEDF